MILCATIIFGFALWDDYRPPALAMENARSDFGRDRALFLRIQVQIMQTVGEILGFSATVNDLLDFGITIF